MQHPPDDPDPFIPLTAPRFTRYAAIATTSDRHAEGTPSTPGQWDLARHLVDELRGLGIDGVELTGHCYALARVPATPGRERAPVVGFLAHLDTSSEVPGDHVRPVLVERYDGRVIPLAGGLCLDPAVDAGLAAHAGKALIHSGGATLLGADDKAGVAAIMGAAEYLIAHPDIPHGPLELIFTPDEEIGRGLPCLPRDRLHAAVCYTLDGGPEGELEAECFNAWAAAVAFTGKSMHLGTARGVMVNAALMAAAFAAMLPRAESPEATDGRYGYYCPLAIHGDIERADLEIFVRDFDRAAGERRVAALDAFARAVEAQFPGGRVEVTTTIQYVNMREAIERRPATLDLLRRAYRAAGVEPDEKPIRGGTDGSRLTELGIPTPNIFTGMRNAHSRLEWVSVPEMARAARVVVELARLWGEETAAG